MGNPDDSETIEANENPHIPEEKPLVATRNSSMQQLIFKMFLIMHLYKMIK